MTDHVLTAQTMPPASSIGSSPAASALSVELAKCLKLVAPATMTGEAQLAWIAVAVDSLDDIRVEEVRAISAELRRTVTRPNQIVPEIAKLVSERRKRSSNPSEPVSRQAAEERRIDREVHERRGKANTRAEIEDLADWERRERINAGLQVGPIPAPLTRDELDHLPDNIASLGLKYGFLERRSGKLHENQRANINRGG